MPANNERWRLVLASQSPRRKELLSRLGIPFDVVVSGADEACGEADPPGHAQEVALRKARAVAAGLPLDRHWAVVAADTVVALGGKIYGKPQSVAEARAFLRELSGRTHQVHTGLVVRAGWGQDWREHVVVETTEVDFAPIAPALLERYLSSGDSLDKAGGYGIQGDALAFISGIRGCYGSVVGFPLARFCALMEGAVAGARGWEGPWQNYFS